jgi:hypothetical protein
MVTRLYGALSVANKEYTKQLEESHDALQKKLEDTQAKLQEMALSHLHMRRLIDLMRKSYIDMKTESDDCRYWTKAALVDSLMGLDRNAAKNLGSVPTEHNDKYQEEYEKHKKDYQKELGVTLEENMKFIRECFTVPEYNSIL